MNHPFGDESRLVDASSRLLAALSACGDSGEAGLAVVNRLARKLGREPDGFAVFIKLLLIISASGTPEQQRQLARIFSLGLRRGDLPSGLVSLWGGSSLWPVGVPVQAGHFQINQRSSTPQRQLAPVEYLTAWHFQRTQQPQLDGELYATSLARLIELLNQDEECRTMYPRHLRQAAEDPAEGLFSRATRERLLTLAKGWEAGDPPEQLAARLLTP